MFVSPAYAQAAGGAAGGSGLEAFIPMILIFVVFYFLLIRPQQKKMKQHKEMLNEIRRGDKVVTGGGIIATVTKVVNDEELQVEIAEGVKVRVQRGMVSAVVSRTEPAKGAANDAGTKDGAAPAKETAGSRLKGLLGGKK
ncbi:MAG: preprotein translocase subunit YajC [Rhodobacterales bacterium]|nr:preprotein translocase subunit YajC [Rhodobacterales bacterium]